MENTVKTYNPDSRLALATSYRERADAIKAGRGFWNGRVICNDPEKCKKKREDLMAISTGYLIQHYEMVGN